VSELDGTGVSKTQADIKDQEKDMDKEAKRIQIDKEKENQKTQADGEEIKWRILIDEESIRRCFSSECSTCRENCPAYRSFHLDSYSSRGKNRILKAYLGGQITKGDLLELAYTCTMCGQCKEVCLTDGAFFNQVHDLREQLHSHGIHMKGHKEMVQYIRSKGTPYGFKQLEWLKEIGKDPSGEKVSPKQQSIKLRSIKERVIGKVGYFPGCTILANHPELAMKTMRLLHILGIDAVPLTEYCCGSPVHSAGFPEDAKAMAQQFMEELKEKKIQRIITSCAGCTAMLLTDYPELTGSKLKVEHITEVLAGKIKNGRFPDGISCELPEGTKVCYHDPCDLALRSDIIDEPRKVLKALGLHVKEFNRNRRNTECCGGGGGFGRDYAEKAGSSSLNRLNESEVQGVDIIVTACLNCKRMLKTTSANRSGNSHLNTCDIYDILDIIKV
jgi:heterodisulfide reductase subunit D